MSKFNLLQQVQATLALSFEHPNKEAGKTDCKRRKGEPLNPRMFPHFSGSMKGKGAVDRCLNVATYFLQPKARQGKATERVEEKDCVYIVKQIALLKVEREEHPKKNLLPCSVAEPKEFGHQSLAQETQPIVSLHQMLNLL